MVDTNQWNFVDPETSKSTYLLRVTIVRGANVSIAAAMAGRIAALEIADANGGLDDFTVTDQTADTFEATYVDAGPAPVHHRAVGRASTGRTPTPRSR